MAGLLVILTSLVIGVYLTKKFLGNTDDKDVAYTIYTAIGVSSVGVIYRLFYLPYSEFIYQICCLTGMTLLLVSQLMMIRRLKSELFQYPYFMVYTPLIVPFTYFLIYDVEILRDILLTGIGIVPMLVAILLIDSYKKEVRVRTYSIILVGILSLVLINRNLSLLPYQLDNLELIMIGAAGLSLYYLFLKTIKNKTINNDTIQIN